MIHSGYTKDDKSKDKSVATKNKLKKMLGKGASESQSTRDIGDGSSSTMNNTGDSDFLPPPPSMASDEYGAIDALLPPPPLDDDQNTSTQPAVATTTTTDDASAATANTTTTVTDSDATAAATTTTTSGDDTTTTVSATTTTGGDVSDVAAPAASRDLASFDVSDTPVVSAAAPAGVVSVNQYITFKTKSTPQVAVQVKSGVNLIACDTSSVFSSKLTSSDPYVKINYGKKNVSTSVISKNLNPVWSDLAKPFDLVQNIHEIQLAVFDKDKVSQDDSMGVVNVNLLDALQHSKQLDSTNFYTSYSTTISPPPNASQEDSMKSYGTLNYDVIFYNINKDFFTNPPPVVEEKKGVLSGFFSSSKKMTKHAATPVAVPVAAPVPEPPVAAIPPPPPPQPPVVVIQTRSIDLASAVVAPVSGSPALAHPRITMSHPPVADTVKHSPQPVYVLVVADISILLSDTTNAILQAAVIAGYNRVEVSSTGTVNPSVVSQYLSTVRLIPVSINSTLCSAESIWTMTGKKGSEELYFKYDSNTPLVSPTNSVVFNNNRGFVILTASTYVVFYNFHSDGGKTKYYEYGVGTGRADEKFAVFHPVTGSKDSTRIPISINVPDGTYAVSSLTSSASKVSSLSIVNKSIQTKIVFEPQSIVVFKLQ